MRHTYSRWGAWLILLLSVAAWVGFGAFVWLLKSERVTHASLLEERAIEQVREDSQSRVKTLVRDTLQERESLASAVRMPVVGAVEIIEAAGRDAGARDVVIVEATPQTLTNKELSAVSVTVQAEGSFAALAKAVSLFETLPLASTVENVHFEYVKDAWRLTVRLRVVLASQTL